jgi:primosomal protein N'
MNLALSAHYSTKHRLIATPLNGGENGHKEPVVVNLDEISADELNLAMESDASQDSVVVSAQSSQCTVVRGPPGTGKSQVIVNLISNALAKGQKVLLVCQKALGIFL